MYTPEQIEKEFKKLRKLICCSSSGGGDVASVFGRTGAVVAVAGDYDFSEIGNPPTTLLGYGITDAQPSDEDLTAIAALAGTSGFLTKTGVNTWALDTNTYITGLNINQLGAASGTATINNAANELEWQWNTLAGTEGLNLTSTSTAAASNAQRLLSVSLSGANANSAQTTVGGFFSNTHTGTTSTNYGIQAVASGGTTANFAIFTGTDGTNGRLNVNAATDTSTHTVLIRSINNTNDAGLQILANNQSQSTTLAFNGVRGSGNLFISAAGSSHVLIQPGGRTGIGSTVGSAPTAHAHIAASTTAAASLRIPTGTAPTSPNEGDIWHNSNNLLFFTNSTTHTVAKILSNTATLDFPSTAAQTSSDLTITVTGAAVGDAVSIGVPNGSITADTTWFGWVSATNTVTIRHLNSGTLPSDPASGSFRAVVHKI
jgi:hypothetical protein